MRTRNVNNRDSDVEVVYLAPRPSYKEDAWSFRFGVNLRYRFRVQTLAVECDRHNGVFCQFP
jgi:hypothetical protein